VGRPLEGHEGRTLTDYVQRVFTKGDVAPTGGTCDPAVDRSVGVPYTAVYMSTPTAHRVAVGDDPRDRSNGDAQLRPGVSAERDSRAGPGTA
jgi:hypothetical protein